MLSDTLKKAVQNLPAIISINEAANFFKVCYLTVWRLIDREELPAYKDDENNWCILRGDLINFCSKNCNL